MKNLNLSFLLITILCLSLFLVSCTTSDVADIESKHSSLGERVSDTEEPYEDEEELSSDEAPLEEDPQYSMGLNSEFIDDSFEDSSAVTSSIENTPLIVPDVMINDYMLTERSVKLDVAYLPQKPELPSGCEITSLTTVLNFYGYNVTKTEMADNYLPKSDTDKDFWSVFVGNPRYNTGFGCYAQPITDAANKYLTQQGSTLTAYNYSGSEFEQLLLEVEMGRPVVIWGTLNMAKPYYTYKWLLEDGTERQWIAPEHCLVLIGYDLDRGVAVISDPMRGIVEYDLATVKSRYMALYSQCVLIY